MRSILLVVTLVSLILSPIRALAIEEKQSEFSLGGGASVPVGDFEEVAKTGFNFGANYGYYVSSQFSLGVEAKYHRYAASDELEDLSEALFFILTGLPVDLDITWSVFQGTAYGKFLFVDGDFSPYLRGTVGYYSLRLAVSAFGQSDSESDGNIGFGGGLGIQFYGQGNVGGFVEAMIHSIATEGSATNFIEARAGVNILVGAQ